MEIRLIVHALIVNRVNEILLIKRVSHAEMFPNLWDIPGGTLKDGEDPTNGVTREVREETGLSIDKLNLFTYTSDIDKEKDAQFIRLIFHSKTESEAITLNSNEHSEYIWMEKKDIDKYPTVNYLAEVINKL
jgi:8-oxo-dGTP diphosphatase|tara:strand:- start:162 stop:557 length:396 start_codon:yes stop_codon:yes gene_type:complete